MSLDYQSPVKNFGETLILGELEEKACIDLCTKPMEAISLDPKLITQSLERLELAFILNREKSTYSYKVPLFTQYLKERETQVRKKSKVFTTTIVK